MTIAPQGALLSAFKSMERKLKPREQETRSIDINDDYALDYWAKELNVSQIKLKNAVLAVGSNAVDVKKELKK